MVTQKALCWLDMGEEQEAPVEGLIAQSTFLEKQKHAFHLHDELPCPDISEVCAFNTCLRKPSILCTHPACGSQHTAWKREDQLKGERARRMEHWRYNSPSQKPSICSALSLVLNATARSTEENAWSRCSNRTCSPSLGTPVRISNLVSEEVKHGNVQQQL